MKKQYILLIVLLMTTKQAFPQPDITSVSASLVHGRVMQINGSGFGSKNPAPPLLWDDCNIDQSLSIHYDAYKPKSAQQGEYYNIAYRISGFRNIDSPNKRTNYFIGGAHAINRGINGDDAGGNVALGKNMNSHSYFISYYYRIDPDFDEESNISYGDNMKELVLSDTAGQFYPDGERKFGYAAWCGGSVPGKNFTSSIRLGRIPISPENQELPYACTQDQYSVYHNNPVNSWIKMQWEGTYNHQHDAPQISLTTYPDGHRTHQSHYGDGITVLEYHRGLWVGFPKENDLRFVGIGGFGRIPRENNGINSFRYFAAVYMDNTHSRVMLGDQPDYSACTIMEPLIPSTWNDTTITVSVNLGSLSDQATAYLFVFDANNSANLVGYPVTIGAAAVKVVPLHLILEL